MAIFIILVFPSLQSVSRGTDLQTFRNMDLLYQTKTANIYSCGRAFCYSLKCYFDINFYYKC